MTDLHQVHKENVFEKELVEYLGTHGWKDPTPNTTKNWLSIPKTS